MTGDYNTGDRFPDERPYVTTEAEALNSSPPGSKLHWIDCFLGVILEPRKTFGQLSLGEASTDSLTGAVILVALISSLNGLQLVSAKEIASAFVLVPISIVIGLLYWAALAGLLAALASCFGVAPQRIRALFPACGWALLPWIFLPSLFCYSKTLGPMAIWLCGLPALWSFILQIRAVSIVLQLKSWQTAILFFVAPFLFELLQLMQFVQTLYNSFFLLK